MIARLQSNRVRRTYLGGGRIDAFCRTVAPEAGQPCPEDWLASTTTAFNGTVEIAGEGLGRMEDGRLVKDVVGTLPVLVKLLDSDERLVIQAHPTVPFAKKHLNSPVGKTECWYFLPGTAPDACVYLGFRPGITRGNWSAAIRADWEARSRGTHDPTGATCGGSFDTVYETRMFDSEEPLPDTPCGRAGVGERMVERLEEFCDIAERHGLRLIVPLLTGQMTFRNLIPPALANRNPFSDPYALAWEGRYLECMVSRLKAKKAIVAWAAGNEASILGRCENAFHAEAWSRYVHSTIRLADPSRPVIGLHHLAISRENAWSTKLNATMGDCLTSHPYGFWGDAYNDDFRTVRSVTFAPAETLALAQIGGKPAFIEEHGSRRQEQASQEHVADYMRAMLWNAWAADCRAMLWWCAFDQTGMTHAPYNWRQPCVELGLFRRDRTPYPAVASFRDFAAMQERLPFDALPPAKTDAVVLTTDRDVVFSTYVLARQAGIFPFFANPEEKLPEARVYFLPDARERAFLTIERWEELKAKVRAGATLYLSWNDTFLDGMEAVGGIEIARREKAAGTDVCDFGDFKVEIGYGVKRVFKTRSAETLACNQNGEGVFFRNRYGKGTVYVCAHNFEKTFYAASGKYEGDGYRIWEKVCPVSRLLTTDEKNVFVSEHRFGDGRCAVIAVNNRPVAYDGKPALKTGWRVASSVTDDGAKATWKDGRLGLAANAGVLLMLEKN